MLRRSDGWPSPARPPVCSAPLTACSASTQVATSTPIGVGVLVAAIRGDDRRTDCSCVSLRPIDDGTGKGNRNADRALGELLDIVSAVRAIAASQMQQARRSLEAIRRYSGMVREPLSGAATLLPSDGKVALMSELSSSALILFCAERGPCGGFNEHPLHVVESALADRAGRFVLIVVGSRGSQICPERGLKPDLVLPMTSHCAGVTGAARRVATEVYRMFSDGRIAGLEVVCAQRAGSQFSRIERHRPLPLEIPAVERRALTLPPLINLSRRRLFDDIRRRVLLRSVGERRNAIVLQRELYSFPHDGSRASEHWK